MQVELVSHDASDLKCVNAARISYKGHSDELSDKDKGLINAMLREHHGSVFEHSTFTFRVEAPIVVLRQWHRHRAGHSYNEQSGRYTEASEKFYAPSPRTQTGKAMSYEYAPMGRAEADRAQKIIDAHYTYSYAIYKRLLADGLAKEAARYVLPQGLESSMYWTCNARSLMHFLSLRAEKHAALEIRLLAEQAEEIFAMVMPVTHEAFNKHGRIAP